MIVLQDGESHHSLDLSRRFFLTIARNIDQCRENVFPLLSPGYDRIGLSSYFRELRMDDSDYATAICGLLRMKELLDFYETMGKSCCERSINRVTEVTGSLL